MRKKRRPKRALKTGINLHLTGKAAVVIASVMVVLQIFTAIQTSSSGAVLADLEQQELDLIKENQELQSRIVDKSSLIRIREQSDDLGFQTPGVTFYITEQDTVALLK